jgi:hypothetical protein
LPAGKKGEAYIDTHSPAQTETVILQHKNEKIRNSPSQKVHTQGLNLGLKNVQIIYYAELTYIGRRKIIVMYVALLGPICVTPFSIDIFAFRSQQCLS